MIPEHYRVGWRWFIENQGRRVRWNEIASQRVLLACIPKGIYKPGGPDSPALSVKQTLGSPYRDIEPTSVGDTWMYQYHEERGGLQFWTNRALIESMKRRWPVGVLRQVHPRSRAEYAVLGLAWVAEWRFEYFVLQGLTMSESNGFARGDTIDEGPTAELTSETILDPSSTEDQRTVRLAPVVSREGQACFRSTLIKAYAGRCSVTAFDSVPALQAAHIGGYSGAASNSTANGLLLRADVHLLFDAGLMACNGDSYEILLHPELANTRYSRLAGQRLRLPHDRDEWPSGAALEMHRLAVGL